jgi:hypothetical protein
MALRADKLGLYLVGLWLEKHANVLIQAYDVLHCCTRGGYISSVS